MTHEELLAKIDALEIFDDWLEMTEAFRAVKILRAVVELHKPKEFEFNDCPVFVCGHCQLGVVGDEYPCETIQAIEKELSDG